MAIYYITGGDDIFRDIIKRKSFLFVLIAVFLTMAGSIFFGIMDMESARSSAGIEKSRETDSTYKGTRAPYVSFIEPSGGYSGSSHQLSGSGFGATKGRVGLMDDDFIIIWIDSAIVDWSDNSINFTIPGNITLRDYEVIVQDANGDQSMAGTALAVETRPVINNIMIGGSPVTSVPTDAIFEIHGQNFGGWNGQILFPSPVAAAGYVSYFATGEWTATVITINMSAVFQSVFMGISAGDIVVVTYNGTRSEGFPLAFAGMPQITGVSPEAVYTNVNIDILGTDFGDSGGSVWIQTIVTFGPNAGEVVYQQEFIEIWTDTLVEMMIPYNVKKGECKIIVQANGRLSQPFSITIKEAKATIVNPKEGDEVWGIVQVEVTFPGGTTDLVIEAYYMTICPTTGSPKSKCSLEIKIKNVSEKATSKTVEWDTSDAEDGKDYVIYVSATGSYGYASDSINVTVKQRVVHPISAAASIIVGTGVAAGAGAALGGAAGSTAGSTAGGAAGTGGQGWLSKLLAKIRKLLGELAEEKAHDAFQRSGQKVDEKSGVSLTLFGLMAASVPKKSFIIAFSVTVFAFSLFINGGIFQWKGWINWLIAIPIALVIVSLLMAVSNIFAFWLAKKLNIRIRWRTSIIGLFLLLISSFFNSPMGDVGEQEEGDLKYRKRTRKQLSALFVVSISLVILSITTLFGALALIKNGFVRFNIAYPGAYGALILAFFPLMPFKSSPGHRIWKWSKIWSIALLVPLVVIVFVYSQLWIPGWTILFLGLFSGVVLLLLLFVMGVLGRSHSGAELKTRGLVLQLYEGDAKIRKKARDKLYKILFRRPESLRGSMKDILSGEEASPEIGKEIRLFIRNICGIAPQLLIPYIDEIETYKLGDHVASTPEEKEFWTDMLNQLKGSRDKILQLTDEEVHDTFKHISEQRSLRKKKDEKKKDKDKEKKKEKTKGSNDEKIKDKGKEPEKMRFEEKKKEEVKEAEKDVKKTSSSSKEETPADEEASEKEEPKGTACPKCGEMNDDGSLFCSECGNRFPDSQAEVKEDSTEKKDTDSFETSSDKPGEDMGSKAEEAPTQFASDMSHKRISGKNISSHKKSLEKGKSGDDTRLAANVILPDDMDDEDDRGTRYLPEPSGFGKREDEIPLDDLEDMFDKEIEDEQKKEDTPSGEDESADIVFEDDETPALESTNIVPVAEDEEGASVESEEADFDPETKVSPTQEEVEDIFDDIDEPAHEEVGKFEPDQGSLPGENKDMTIDSDEPSQKPPVEEPSAPEIIKEAPIPEDDDFSIPTDPSPTGASGKGDSKDPYKIDI